jgi:hypothetical protein
VLLNKNWKFIRKKLEEFEEKRDKLQSDVDDFADNVRDIAYDNYYDEIYEEIEDDVFDYFKNHYGYSKNEVLKYYKSGFSVDYESLIDDIFDDFNQQAYRDVFGYSDDTELQDFDGERYIVIYEE